MTNTATAHVSATSTTTGSRGLSIALWVVQAMLAFAFVGSGLMKLTTPHEALAAQMPWVADAPSFLPLFIGAAEVLGALGLILPSVTRIQPKLTPLAAAGLATVMVLAAATHVMYGEFFMLLPNAVLGGLAAFVAWGRFGPAAITAR
ncbi:MAG: DoxX family protein [Deltaproteobacteria bacterium]|nr:DoxX family protein [Deltaproteobacteria bacterium]